MSCTGQIVTPDSLTVRGREHGPAPIRLMVGDALFVFAGGETRVFVLKGTHPFRQDR